MEILGYSLTSPTKCFINGGCGNPVYAHTNGYGDFVLLDALGSPWRVHQCYLDRFVSPEELGDRRPSSAVYTNQELVLQITRKNEAYKEAARGASVDRRRIQQRNIHRVDPQTFDSRAFSVVGYVQSVIEGRAGRFAQGTGAMGEQVIRRALGSRLSQITIIDGDYRSFTAFIDLRSIVLSKGTTVKASIRGIWVLGLNHVFVCDVLRVVPVRPV